MKKILIIVPDGGMLFESAGIADILMQANRLHPEGARETPDTREGGGEEEPVNMEAGCVGLQYTIQLQLAVLFMVAMALAI